MSEARTVGRILPGKRVTDGAGVPVRRTLGDARLPMLDPFLLVDELKSSTAGDLDRGLPQHPHRGIETLTLVIDGQIRVSGSHGIDDTLVAGAAQWTTAASGVIHDEMPVPGTGTRAVQVWLNMPRAEKMEPPRITTLRPEEIPVVTMASGAQVAVVAGSLQGTNGPVHTGHTRPSVFDVVLPPSAGVNLDIVREKTAVLYVLEGQGMFGITGTSTGEMVGRGHLILLNAGDVLKVLSGQAGCRFLVLAAIPIGEPVCRYGPIVMTTPDEIDQAVSDYHANAFLRHARRD